VKALTAVKMAQFLLKDKLAHARFLVDATAGNGRDTLFLATHTPPDVIIRAFDIQEEALSKTDKLLQAHDVRGKVILVLDSHANMAKYCAEPLDVVMFNLGYLPGGEHRITTYSRTTLQAVEQALQLLRKSGIVTIAAYPGHEEGRCEKEELEAFLANLSQSDFNVACWHMVNQINCPPVLYVIEKLREDLA
jgi:threonine dehydrogenase-like Zn-dependent dehydrogenase